MLVFKGIQKTTLIDFPGEVACTLFLPKCNFRCPYCYNRTLVFDEDTGISIPEEEVLTFLEERKDFLDAVCITGGEPTMHAGLPAFCKKLKQRGLLVKVDTNGTNPKMLGLLVEKKLVDYIAMDIKAPLEKYKDVVGVKVNKEALKKSAEIIRKSGLGYEFRTTILPKFLSSQDLLEIGKWLKGSRLYALQQFSPQDTMLDQRLKSAKRYSRQELEAFAKDLEAFFETVEIRNV